MFTFYTYIKRNELLRKLDACDEASVVPRKSRFGYRLQHLKEAPNEQKSNTQTHNYGFRKGMRII